MTRPELPMGFSAMLAQNMKAAEVFGSLTDTEQQKLIDGTCDIRSKEEMRAYVSAIADWGK